MKLTLKIIKYSLIIIVGLLILVLTTLIVAIKTEAGSRYLLNCIPNLSVKEPQGTLSGGWSAQELIWQNEEIKITVKNPTLDWYANCLLKANICIHQLTAKQLDIDLLPQKAGNSSAAIKETTPIKLPTINLPITIDIKKIILDKLLIDQQEIISNALLESTSWQKTRVSIRKLTVYNTQTKANAILQGHIDFANNWPLEINAQGELNEFYQTPWQLTLNVTGNLQTQLQFNSHSNGYLTANLKGAANILEEGLPAALSLTVDNFSPSNLIKLPESLLIKQLKLQTKGNLNKGFAINSQTLFSGHTTPVYLDLQGLVTTKKIDLTKLVIRTSKQHFVDITGKATFQPTLQADATINYQQFPWQELYPLKEPLPVELKTANAIISYQDDNYQSQLTAHLTGPAGNIKFHTALTGDLKKIALNTLQIDTQDKGSITGKATLNFSPSIHWLANLELKKINPHYWANHLTGSLSGVIQSTGTLADTLETNTSGNIQGILNKQAAQIKTTVLAKKNQWHIPELLIKVGSNTIIGQGELGNTLNANLDINLLNLKQLFPTLAGNLVGKAQVSGSLAKPQASIQLTGQHLGFEKQKINHLQLSTTIDAEQKANIKLRANRIIADSTPFGNLNLTAAGNIRNQQLQLQLTGGILTLSAQIKSQQDEQQNWLAYINTLQIASQGQNWQLQNKTQLRYTHAGNLTLSAHCFKNGQATLCANNQQTLLPTTKINYQLTNFAMQGLKPWYPENFNWNSVLSANIELSIPQQGVSGHVEIKTNSGAFQLRENTEDNWHDLSYQALIIVINLAPNKITSSIDFKSNSLGNVHTQLQLNPLARQKPIQGAFSIEGFDISILQPFIPDINELSGKIEGKGTISGILERPYISGKVALKNGTAMGDISTSIENLQATALIEGESLTLDGSWHSGKEGKAKITGEASWSNNLNITMNLQANKLPIIIAPYANLAANTDLKLHLDKDTLSVSGIIGIPSGNIVVRELPPSTVTVSPDAIIVTQEASEQKKPMKINMDVRVLIGQKHLSFEGFGLTSTITGNLFITKNLFTQGEINLRNGVYRAYGQRLTIRRANILFTGSISEPSLDIEAIRVVDNVTAGLRVTGFTSEPRVAVFSTPAMSQDQALSYIIFGRPLGAGDNNVVAQAALAMGVARTSGTVSELASKVGLQDFQLDASGSGNDTNVTASGKINDKLSIHYGVSIFKAVNTIMLRYNLTKTIYLEAAGGTASSLDIFYKRSFK